MANTAVKDRLSERQREKLRRMKEEEFRARAEAKKRDANMSEAERAKRQSAARSFADRIEENEPDPSQYPREGA